jgi:hypothetical protein
MTTSISEKYDEIQIVVLKIFTNMRTLLNTWSAPKAGLVRLTIKVGSYTLFNRMVGLSVGKLARDSHDTYYQIQRKKLRATATWKAKCCKKE